MSKEVTFKDKSGRIITVGNGIDVVNEFCNKIGCITCPIHRQLGAVDCEKWVLEHPKEAGDLMGYTLVGKSKTKSRLAEILGVEEDQEWQTKISRGETYRIHEGRRQRKGSYGWEDALSETALADLIRNPELIIPKKSCTDIDINFSK